MNLTKLTTSLKNESFNEAIDLNTSDYLDISYEIVEGINFRDDYWDFSNLMKKETIKKTHTIYKFNDLKSNIFKYYLKKLIIRLLYSGEIRASTIYGKYCRIKNFIKYLENEVHITVPTAIYDQIIQNYLKKYEYERYRYHIQFSIKEYLIEIEHKDNAFNLNALRSLFTPRDMHKVQYEIENGKTPNIPDRVFKAILQQAIRDLENEDINLVDRMTAGLIILLSQIGLRIGEALLLEIGRLKEEEIFNGKKKSVKLEFWTYKTTGTEDGKWTITFMTSLAIKAYKKLEELGEIRRKNGSKYLYPNPEGGAYSSTAWGTNSLRFFIRNQEIIGMDTLSEIEMNQVAKIEVTDNLVNNMRNFTSEDIGKVFLKVNAHQYRVAVCNYLRKKPGINLQWINKHMNHLEEEMTMHYFRDDNKIIEETILKRSSKQSDLLETEKIRIFDDEIRKELDDPYYIEAYNTINKFLKRNKLKIYKDLNHIISVFQNTPILDSEIGFCTSAMAKLCERQEKLNQLERWFYLRPHVPDIINFNLTNRRLITKLELVKHNKKVSDNDTRYLREFEIQSKAFSYFFNEKFIPEYELLKKQIEINGTTNLVKDNPHLEPILKQLKEVDELVLECSEWLKKI
ncbi:hypothetical protein M3649_20600 [Ureibacillus chungkukjangi]|uniref:hypothetical protein n=1 Tax=Ureibacillus chungkukjangi TaxID=1202712 RepID=UPI00203AB442|nr:hypothetical protein [Ureibacillus chungkukjangi]MCM3390490.1 hypothetical protein [Ureibacillus chungkukjangi]